MQWVKMSEQVPPNPKDKDRINIKFRGLPDTLIYLENSWCWFDNGAKGRFLGYPVPPTGSGSYIKVDKKYIPEIEWLSPDTVQGQEDQDEIWADIQEAFGEEIVDLQYIKDHYSLTKNS